MNGPYQWLRHPEPDDFRLLPDALRQFFGLLGPPEARLTEKTLLAENNASIPDISVQILLTRALRLLQKKARDAMIRVSG